MEVLILFIFGVCILGLLVALYGGEDDAKPIKPVKTICKDPKMEILDHLLDGVNEVPKGYYPNITCDFNLKGYKIRLNRGLYHEYLTITGDRTAGYIHMTMDGNQYVKYIEEKLNPLWKKHRAEVDRKIEQYRKDTESRLLKELRAKNGR